MKDTIYFLGLIFAIVISVVALNSVQPDNFGAISATEYYFNATNSSSSVVSAIATSTPLISKDANRVNIDICNISAYPVFLFPMAEATTTGVEAGKGIYLSPNGLTTSTRVCTTIPGFKGYLMPISQSATATVTWSLHN